VTITRRSVVSDIDKKILDAVAKWKYKPGFLFAPPISK
jgi:hypothetical protein